MSFPRLADHEVSHSVSTGMVWRRECDHVVKSRDAGCAHATDWQEVRECLFGSSSHIELA